MTYDRLIDKCCIVTHTITPLFDSAITIGCAWRHSLNDAYEMCMRVLQTSNQQDKPSKESLRSILGVLRVLISVRHRCYSSPIGWCFPDVARAICGRPISLGIQPCRLKVSSMSVGCAGAGLAMAPPPRLRRHNSTPLSSTTSDSGSIVPLPPDPDPVEEDVD